MRWGLATVTVIGAASSPSLLESILAGGLMAAIVTASVTVWAERRRSHREEKQERRADYLLEAQRDDLLSETTQRAVAIMRESLAQAEKDLETMRAEVKTLRDEVQRLQGAIEAGSDEREQLQQRLDGALKEIAKREIRERQLSDRVKLLEAATETGRRHTDHPGPDPDARE